MNRLPPILKAREHLNPFNPSPISSEDLEFHCAKMYDYFYKAFYKYLGQHSHEIISEDVQQEIKVFILMNWNGDSNFLKYRFSFWMCEYRDQIKKSLCIKNKDVKNTDITNEQISPMTYLWCKSEINYRLERTKENKLNQIEWIEGFYEHFKIKIPQTEYDLLTSRASVVNPERLTKLVQNGSRKVMLLYSQDSEVVVVVRENQVSDVYTYNWFCFDPQKKELDAFLNNYKENKNFWNFVENKDF